MKNLEEQIKELKSKHEIDLKELQFKGKMLKMFPKLKQLVYMRDCHRDGISHVTHFSVVNKKEVAAVLKKLKPTEIETIVGTAGNDNYKIIESPFRIDINNPATSNNVSTYEMQINYKSDEVNVRINIPIKLVKDYLDVSSRHITDSEGVHFIGTSHAEMRRMKILQYVFKSQRKMTWYGGNQTLLEESVIEDIIGSIIN